jgi:hypothetical protein
MPIPNYTVPPVESAKQRKEMLVRDLLTAVSAEARFAADEGTEGSRRDSLLAIHRMVAKLDLEIL